MTCPHDLAIRNKKRIKFAGNSQNIIIFANAICENEL